MSLVPCPECGHPISTEARACPSCGFKIRKGPRLLSIVLTVAGILFIAGWIFTWIYGLEQESERSTPSWQQYPRNMTLTEAAPGYHYPYANEIQKVADFRPGQSVKVLQQSGEWFQVQLSDDARCWVHQTHPK